jgi:hypothetical protein
MSDLGAADEGSRKVVMHITASHKPSAKVCGATSDWMVSAGSTRRGFCDETSCSSKLYYRYADCADILTGSFRSGRDAARCRGNDAACCRGNDRGLEDARVRCVQFRWDTAGTLIGSSWRSIWEKQRLMRTARWPHRARDTQVLAWQPLVCWRGL